MSRRFHWWQFLLGMFCGSVFMTLSFFLRPNDVHDVKVGNTFTNCSTKQDYIISPDIASIEDILRYMKWSNSTSCLLVQDFGGQIVKNGDGPTAMDGQKSVCLDKGVAPVPSSCVVYSFGVNDDWSFDEAMGRYGCRVFAFDPFIGREDHQRSGRIYFYNMGLFGRDEMRSDGSKFRTLDSIHRVLQERLPHAVIDYVKVDIEDSEWKTIPNIISSGILGRVKQIGFEIHLITANSLEIFRTRYKIVKSIEDAGFVRFASRMNLFGKGRVESRASKTAVLAYELAWYNPKYYQTDDTV